MDELQTPPPVVHPVPYAPPVMMMQPRKSRWWLWLLLGGGGLVGLVLLCAGGFAWFLVSGKAEIDPVIEAFQTRLDAEDFAGAYQSIGPEWKAVNTEAVFTEFEKAVRIQFGKFVSKSMQSINIKDTGTGMATMTYACTFEKGRADVTYTLAKSTGSWLVIGHQVDSPLMTQLLTCPKCGTVAQSWSDFCGQCGAKMGR